MRLPKCAYCVLPPGCSIENDLMTPSMKLKRPQLATRFQPQASPRPASFWHDHWLGCQGAAQLSQPIRPSIPPLQIDQMYKDLKAAAAARS